MTDSSKDRIEGTVDEVGGKLKSAVGDATGNEQAQAEGKADQAGGQVKQGIADLKDKADDLVKKVTGN